MRPPFKQTPFNHPYNTQCMEMNLYVYKLNILDGKPPRRWLIRARWYVLKTERTPRFKSVLSIIDTYHIPTVVLDPKRLIVVKCDMVHEFLTYMAPDLMYDAILTPEDKKALELNDYWETERVELDKRGVALWKLGLETKASDKVRVVRERFKAILEDLKEVRV